MSLKGWVDGGQGEEHRWKSNNTSKKHLAQDGPLRNLGREARDKTGKVTVTPVSLTCLVEVFDKTSKLLGKVVS